MPPGSALAAFSLAAGALILMPGPSVLFVISRGVALGRRAALVSVLGNEAGLAVNVVAVALGLGAVVQGSAIVFTVLKLVGAAYLVHLGIAAIRNRRSLAAVLDAAALPRTGRRLFGEGFLVGVTNPKTMIFLAAILPQFVEPDAGSVGLQMLVLGAILVLIALTLDCGWAVAAGSARNALASSPRRLERLGSSGGVVMIGLGLRLAVAGRPD